MGVHPHHAGARRRDFCLLVTLCLVSMLLLLAVTLLSPSPSSSIHTVAADSIESRLGRTDLRLEWRTDFDLQNIEIKVTTSTSDLAWILVGFSDQGAYNGSDFCIYMDGKMKDGHLSASSELLSDCQQDCQLSHSSPTGFSFMRKFTTCDPRDYRFEAGTTQLIIAGGYEPVRSLNKHNVFKELKYANVMQVDSPPPSIESDAFEVEIRAESLIPASVTNYFCIVQQLPASIVARKHHAVKIEAIVQPGNEQLVHHMEVFLCVDPVQRDYNGDRNAAGKPSESRSCSKVVAAWAMGEGPVLFPPQAGLSLGGPDSSAYVMVEIHYNNVKKSGVRMTLTKRLREFDAAIMELGLVYSDANSIPPGQPAFPLTGYCVPECTKKHRPASLCSVRSSMRISPEGSWTSVYREGVKIGELNRDDHYSPHWQHLQRIQPAFRVMPPRQLRSWRYTAPVNPIYWICVYTNLRAIAPISHPASRVFVLALVVTAETLGFTDIGTCTLNFIYFVLEIFVKMEPLTVCKFLSPIQVCVSHISKTHPELNVTVAHIIGNVSRAEDICKIGMVAVDRDVQLKESFKTIVMNIRASLIQLLPHM